MKIKKSILRDLAKFAEAENRRPGRTQVTETELIALAKDVLAIDIGRKTYPNAEAK
jgi:hypothetical protein